MYTVLMKLSLMFSILSVLGSVLSKPYGGDAKAVVDDRSAEKEIERKQYQGQYPGQYQDYGTDCSLPIYTQPGDWCGLEAYKVTCSPRGPCAYNGYNGYKPVINNPYFFIQCGSGSITYCQPCGRGTTWNQDLKNCD